MITSRTCLAVIALASMLPAGSGCTHDSEPAGPSPASAKGRSAASTGSGLVAVTTVTPTRRNLTLKFEQPGQVEAAASADLYSKVAGYVKSVHSEIGDAVKADQVLLEVDVPELTQELAYKEAALEQARAQHSQVEAGVQEAEANLEAHVTQVALAAADVRKHEADLTFRNQEAERYRDLASRSATTAQLAQEKAAQAQSAAAALEGAKAQQKAVADERLVLIAKREAARAEVRANLARIKVAEADRDRTRVMFDDARMRAPFDGIIIKRNVDEGAYVRSPSSDRATPIMTLARVDRVRVVLHVPEREVLAIRPGCRASIALPALGEIQAEGKVARTSRALNDQKTMRVEIDVDNPDGRLYPGMYGHATVILQEVSNALTVPASALDSDNGHPCLIAVAKGVAHRITVKTGFDDGHIVQILDGLQGFEQIVVSNKGEIQDGQTVTVSPAEGMLSSAPTPANQGKPPIQGS